MSVVDRYDENLLLGYVEGDLSPDDKVRFEQLMLQDARLRNLVAQLLLDRQALRQMPRESAPPQLMEAVNAQLERAMLLDAPVQKPSLPFPVRPARLGRLLAIGSLAAMILLGVSLIARNFLDTFRPTDAKSLHRPGPADSNLAMHTEQDALRDKQKADALARANSVDDRYKALSSSTLAVEAERTGGDRSARASGASGASGGSAGLMAAGSTTGAAVARAGVTNLDTLSQAQAASLGIRIQLASASDAQQAQQNLVRWAGDNGYTYVVPNESNRATIDNQLRQQYAQNYAMADNRSQDGRLQQNQQPLNYQRELAGSSRNEQGKTRLDQARGNILSDEAQRQAPASPNLVLVLNPEQVNHLLDHLRRQTNQQVQLLAQADGKSLEKDYRQAQVATNGKLAMGTAGAPTVPGITEVPGAGRDLSPAPSESIRRREMDQSLPAAAPAGPERLTKGEETGRKEAVEAIAPAPTIPPAKTLSVVTKAAPAPALPAPAGTAANVPAAAIATAPADAQAQLRARKAADQPAPATQPLLTTREEIDLAHKPAEGTQLDSRLAEQKSSAVNQKMLAIPLYFVTQESHRADLLFNANTATQPMPSSLPTPTPNAPVKPNP